MPPTVIQTSTTVPSRRIFVSESQRRFRIVVRCSCGTRSRSFRSAARSCSSPSTATAWARSSSSCWTWRFATARSTRVRRRPWFVAVLAKVLARAGRVGQSVSLILFDVDHLSTINQEHGYGVGDRILERLGILIGQYFRQYDWVARHSEDSIAVLLSGTDAAHASELAERVRATVEERLEFVDHRTDQPVRVTTSVAVVNLDVAVGDVIDPERLLADAETGVERANQ